MDKGICPKDVNVSPNEEFLEDLEKVLTKTQWEQFDSSRLEAIKRYGKRTTWNISSTAKGGGVAEMLYGVIGGVKSINVDMKWVVIQGSPEFFQITKRIHNGIHGKCSKVDNDLQLGDKEHKFYLDTLAKYSNWLVANIKPRDIVILHDPQTAGLTDIIKRLGALVVWRCHIGRNEPNEVTDKTWNWLLPFIENVDATVFSRKQYIPAKLLQNCSTCTNYIIPPAIDPFSFKNCDLDSGLIPEILESADLITYEKHIPETLNGKEMFIGKKKIKIVSKASIVRAKDEMLNFNVPLVLQISRWDHLKDMLGVMKAWVQFVIPYYETNKAHLMLVGPETKGVADDPEAIPYLMNVLPIGKH